MRDPLFTEIRKAISAWIDGYNAEAKRNILAEVLKDDANCLRVELNFGELLAEILVDEPDFAPYRYVSFQAIGMVDGNPELLYFWYDKGGMDIEETIEGLSKAVDVVWEYNKTTSN